MQGWQTSYLGLRDVPVEISECEPQAFFSFSRAELELIARRLPGYERHLLHRELSAIQVLAPAQRDDVGRGIDR